MQPSKPKSLQGLRTMVRHSSKLEWRVQGLPCTRKAMPLAIQQMVVQQVQMELIRRRDGVRPPTRLKISVCRSEVHTSMAALHVLTHDTSGKRHASSQTCVIV